MGSMAIGLPLVTFTPSFLKIGLFRDEKEWNKGNVEHVFFLVLNKAKDATNVYSVCQILRKCIFNRGILSDHYKPTAVCHL